MHNDPCMHLIHNRKYNVYECIYIMYEYTHVIYEYIPFMYEYMYNPAVKSRGTSHVVCLFRYNQN